MLVELVVSALRGMCAELVLRDSGCMGNTVGYKWEGL